MGALRSIIAFITNGQASARVRRIQAAAHARHQALVAYAEAKRRGDTRTIHQAQRSLRDATQACLRAEITQ